MAGFNLITEQLAADDVASAARTLTALEEHATGPLVRLRGVQVACREGNFETAIGRFRSLAADPEASRDVLREAVQAFDAEGWVARLNDELQELAFAPDANPDIAALWADRAVADGAADAVSDRVPALLAEPGGR